MKILPCLILVSTSILSVPGLDYVFDKDYKLTPLEEIKSYIDQNKHLPDVPSAEDMERDGIQLGEMNMLLLKKIEELTLYVIELKKEKDALASQVVETTRQVKSQREELDQLAKRF